MIRLLTGTALALALALPATAQDADTVLARVNGVDITLGHLIAMRERLPQQYLQLPDEMLYEGMLDQIIQQQALADIAREDMEDRWSIGLENEERAFLAGRIIDRIAATPLDEEAVQARYDAEYGDVTPDTEYNASHILVETEAEAQTLVAQLEEGADFAELARTESTGPSGPSGGELGWFSAGQMVAEFQTAVEALEPGEVSAPVQTQFGWHVITLNETRDSAIPTLEDVRAELESALRGEMVEAELAVLQEGAEVEKMEVELDPALIRSTDLLD